MNFSLFQANMAQTFKRRLCHVDDRIWGWLFASVRIISCRVAATPRSAAFVSLIVPTLFSGWYYSHYALANGIWYALIVLGLILCIVSLVRKIRSVI